MLSVLATLLTAPAIALAQPPVIPPNPIKVPNLPATQLKTSLSLWQPVAGSTFETTHPYANNSAIWKQIYLPADATKLRLVTSGPFELEANYDFFELWAVQNSAWVRLKRYTGTLGPSLTEEFVGQYFYLKLATDPSTSKYGFKVSAEYRD